MIPKLPFSRKFPMHAEAAIYPPKPGRATVLKGDGYWTLSFEPTKEPNIATVKLKDIRLKVFPFSFVFDIDHDGRMQYIQVEKFVAGLKDFDQNGTKGTINLETGEFSMALDICLKPKTVPLLKQLGIGPLEVSVTEKGIINLKTGNFKTHAGLFTIPKGPLAGMMVRAGQGPRSETTVPVYPVYSWVELFVSCLVPPVDPAQLRAKAPPNKEITICPGDPIMLSWRASPEVPRVQLFPGFPTDFPPTGNTNVDPGPTEEAVYLAKPIGGYDINPPKTDTVIVHVFDYHNPVHFSAPADIEYRKWSIYVPPECWSGNIRVTQLKIVRPGETEKKDCIDWPKFMVEHWGIGEDTPHIMEALRTWNDVPGYFPVAGRWDFWPKDSTPNWSARPMPQVCFAIRGECVRA